MKKIWVGKIRLLWWDNWMQICRIKQKYQFLMILVLTSRSIKTEKFREAKYAMSKAKELFLWWAIQQNKFKILQFLVSSWLCKRVSQLSLPVKIQFWNNMMDTIWASSHLPIKATKSSLKKRKFTMSTDWLMIWLLSLWNLMEGSFGLVKIMMLKQNKKYLNIHGDNRTVALSKSKQETIWRP